MGLMLEWVQQGVILEHEVFFTFFVSNLRV